MNQQSNFDVVTLHVASTIFSGLVFNWLANGGDVQNLGQWIERFSIAATEGSRGLIQVLGQGQGQQNNQTAFGIQRPAMRSTST